MTKEKEDSLDGKEKAPETQPQAKDKPKKKKKEDKPEEVAESRQVLRADKRRPDGAPDGTLKIEVFSKGGSRAMFIASVEVSDDKGKPVTLNKMSSLSLRECLAFLENEVTSVA